MSDKPIAPSPAEQAPLATSQSSVLARRRLLRGGLGIAPVLMAAAPRSVMAGGAPGACVPASSFASINASRPDQLFTCAGRTPGFWKQEQKFVEWPSGYVPTGAGATLFDAKAGGAAYPGKTMLDVLSLPANSLGRDAVARHIAAALLNAAKGWTPGTVLSESTVRMIWAEFLANGYYTPTAGIKWFADYSVPGGSGGIIPWLTSTMPV